MTSIMVASGDGLHVDGSVVAFAGRDVTTLAPADGGWLAVTDRSEAHRVALDFSAVSLGTASAQIDSIASFGRTAVAGVGDARLEALDGSPQRDAAFDAAVGRDTWYTPWGGPPAVRSLDQGLDGRRWANVHVGGVLVGDDSGWRPTMDIDNDVHQVIADPVRPASAWAAAAVGLGWTTDGGASWSWTDEGMQASYARAVAVAGDAAFVSGSKGPGGRKAMLYRGSPTAGLEPCAGPFDENINTGWLAARGAVVAFLTPTGGVMVSSDRGTTWEEAFRVGAPRALLLV
ncbi:MAG TPA: hypothetical protein VGB41_02935 [Acidimicrobiia bacterium]